MTPSGIEAATCRFVAYCLNHYPSPRTPPIRVIHKKYSTGRNMLDDYYFFNIPTKFTKFSCVYLLYSYVYLLYSYVCIDILNLDAGLLARSKYPECPASGHLDTGFSWFPCVYKRMLRWFPSFQVATTCLSCSPPDLNFLVTFFIFVYM